MSGTGRVLRKRKQIDYNKLNTGRLEASEDEDEMVEVYTDLKGEKELCGSFNEEDKEEYESLRGSGKEDGEISVEEDSEDEDNEIQMCIRTGNLDKLKRILRKREEDCKTLEKEMKRERMKEQKEKEMKQVLSKLTKVSKTRRDLRKSLASSRHSSPCGSPRVKGKEDRRSSRTTGKNKQGESSGLPSKEQRSEYDNVFRSFLNLRQGNADYADRVANAMAATDSILTLSQDRNDAIKVGQTGKTNNNRKGGKVKGKTNKGSVNAILDIIDQFANKGDNSRGGDIAEELLSALNSDCYENKETDLSDRGGKVEIAKEVRRKGKTLELLDNIKKCITGEPGSGLGEEKTDESVKGKLVSGKCTKPDESDIKLVVKYPHEKLDPKHIQTREFDALDFNFLIAGELELISLGNITEEERSARIEVAKTLCYHKRYLEDKHLREGYDSIMKQVEQGKLKWDDSISQKLHDHLDYRANVIMRKNIEDRTEIQQKGEQKKTEKKVEQPGKDRVYYCLEFNLGTCEFEDHHEGSVGQRKKTKLHICRKCHREGEVKSHRDVDPGCPNKKRS